MKIIVGGFYHESNTFNPFPTGKEGFVLAEGEEMLQRVASTQVFQRMGAEVIPTIHAFGLSSGIVAEETYRYYADKILDVIKQELDIDGIWLHLHGSMTVQNLGSGELQLLKEIRKVIGFETPISLTLDIHGNNASELSDYANIIRSYRTVPHVDQDETESITAELLINCIQEKSKVKPVIIRLPMIIGGEQALGNKEPIVTIFKELEEIEKNKGISTASFFIGFSWADTEVSAASVVVVPKSEEYYELAKEIAVKLSEFIYAKRNEFEFDAIALEPKEAIERALTTNLKPIFISDSGDNTTGGGVGINTGLLERFLHENDLKGKKICISAIFDEKSYAECEKYEVGEQITVSVGSGYDESSKSILITGILKAKGDLMGYLGATSDKVGNVCTVSVGDIDIVIANKGDSFITVGHFEAAGLNIADYDVIVVKQGYLFAELSEISKLDILALTPGATYQILEKLEFNHVSRPMFPLDV